MKFHHLMDNKTGRASGGICVRHDVSRACPPDVEFSMAAKLDNLEVNANETFCAREVVTSPKSPYDDVGFDNSGSGDLTSSGELLESCGLVTEDSGISENSLSLTEELEVEKILDDITEREESVDDVTDSEESIGSNRMGGAASQSGNQSRSIGQIRESLEQKVRRLRDEKAAVDEKIRLAQEEEDLRMREKTKLKQQLVVHRRDRLKKVIADLKRKLEDQSVRLQVTYSTLISLQRNIFRHRSFSRQTTQPSRDSSLEAPF
ncbi:uncharacterized protein LOC119724434 [Patiria miniata]|uniref:Uncharacterized protein n=1 Tax=Patiria miniata TaxID=46514 RepID=A0A913ZI11_PATMI|nr:uncharacterized protein LOC119724434 [Patiria miniata]